LAEQGVSQHQLRRWRLQVFADTLELGWSPEEDRWFSVEESAAVARLIKENQALQERLSAQQAPRAALASKRLSWPCNVGPLTRWKSIEILHHADAGKNSHPDRVEPERPEPGPGRPGEPGVEPVPGQPPAQQDASVRALTLALVSALVSAGLSQRRALPWPGWRARVGTT